MADFQVSGELDLENLDQVAAEMGAAFKEGSTQGAKAIEGLTKSIVRRIQGGRFDLFGKSFTSAEKSMRNTEARLRSLAKLGKAIDFDASGLNIANQNLDEITRKLRQIDTLLEKGDTAGARRALQSGQLARQALTADVNIVRRQLANLDTLKTAQAQQQRARDRAALQSQRIASSQAIVAQQTSSAQSVADTRAAAQRRVEIIRAAVGQIRALERGLGAAFRTTSNAIGSSFSGIGRTISSALARARTDTSRLDRTFTSGVGGALGRREGLLRSSFSRQERILSSSVSRQSATIQRLERVLSGGALGALTGRSAAAGALGLGGIGAAIGGGALGASLLTSGFQRFSELERLNRQFLALTQNQEASLALMDEIKAFAKVTPFDLVGVADLAKGFLAIGTAAGDVLPQVKTIADAVALTGGGTDELVRIQRAIGQVVSAGRLQGDELNQLAENLPGLNIRKLLADQLTGGDTAALIEMQEAGEISADMFLNGILTGLSTDVRLAGAAEDLAGTLKGRFDNLKEGFSDLGASLIGLVATPMGQAFAILQTGFANFAQFLRGEGLSEGLEILRSAAGGAAAAIGALVVAKVAGEALQILALGVRALLSPFGLLIAIVGGIGAVIGVLLDNSPRLGAALEQTGRIFGVAFEALGSVVSTIADGLREALGITGPILQAIGDRISELVRRFNSVALPWIRNTLIPAFQTFATFMAETVFPAVRDGLGKAIDFIRTTIIPGFQTFISFMGDTVIPFIRDKLGGAFEAVQEIIDNFDLGTLARIGGVIAAALGGLAIAGPVGGLIAGVGAAAGLLFTDSLGAAILDGLKSLGGLIGGALEGPFNAVKSFLADFFSPENLQGIAFGFLDLVQRLGEIIGNIATDPRLIAAIGGIAAAAVAVGFRFVQGLILGISSNLPELYAMLKNAGGLALEALLSALSDPGVILPAIGAILIGGSLLSAWRAAGTRAGGAVAQGFFGSFRTNAFGGAFAGGGAGTRGGGAGAFVENLLFGAGGVRSAEARLSRQSRQLLQSQQRILREAGQFIRPGAGEGLAAAAQRQFDQLLAQVGPSGVTALRFRASVRQLFEGGFKGLPQFAAQNAAAIGRGIVSGVAGALAGGAIGRSIGASGGGFLDAALGIGATAAAMAAINPAAGVAAAGVGILGFAFGQLEASAALARAEIEEYRSAIGDLGGADLKQAAVQTVIKNIGDESERTRGILRDLNFDAGGFAERIISTGADGGREFAILADNLGEAGKAFGDLVRAKNIQGYAELFNLVDGNAEAARLFADSFGEAGIKLTDLGDVMDALGDEGGELENALGKIRDQRAFEQIAREAAQSLRPVQQLTAELLAARAAVREDPGSFIPGVPATGFAAAAAAAEDVREIETAAAEAREELDRLFGTSYGGTLQSEIDDLILSLGSIPASLEGLDLGAAAGAAGLRQGVAGFVDGFKEAIREGIEDGAITATPEIAIQRDFVLGELARVLDADGLTPVEAQFLMDATLQLNQIVDDPATAEAIAAHTAALSPVDVDVPITPTFKPSSAGGDIQTKIREAILGRGSAGGTQTIGGGPRGRSFSVGNAIDFPVTVNPDITVGPTTTDVMGQIRARIFGAGAAEGGVGALKAITFPITVNPQITIGNFAGIVAVGPTIINAIVLGIAIGLGQIQSAMARVVALIAAAAGPARSAGTSVAQGAVQGLVSGSAAAQTAGVRLALLFAGGINSGRGVAVGAARALGAAASSAVATSTGAAQAAGANLANALASGIRSATPNAVAAARALANAVAAAARSALQITSPSKLFHKIGVNVVDGLRQGIASQEQIAAATASNFARTMAEAMTSSFQGAAEHFLQAIDDVVEAANQKAALAAGLPLKTLAARLFDSNTLQALNEVGGAAFSAGVAGLQGLGARFGTALQETKLAIERAHETLNEQGWVTAVEHALLNQDFLSLDAFGAAGSRNVQAFLELGGQIRNFVTEQLNAGRNLEEVVRFAQFFRDDLVAGAGQFGVDLNTVNVLLNQLGLSDAALADFVNQVHAATRAVDGQAKALEDAAAAEAGREAAEKAAEAAAKSEAERLELLRIAAFGRPIQVHTPFGDPEAVALAVMNRQAVELSLGL